MSKQCYVYTTIVYVWKITAEDLASDSQSHHQRCMFFFHQEQDYCCKVLTCCRPSHREGLIIIQNSLVSVKPLGPTLVAAEMGLFYTDTENQSANYKSINQIMNQSINQPVNQQINH